MSSCLISKTHYNDLGLELAIDTNQIKVCLSKNSRSKALLQAFIILVVELLFFWNGLSTGYLLQINYGLLVLIITILLGAVILPPALHIIRINQVGGHIIKFDKMIREFDGNYFKSLSWADVDCFVIVSEKLGEVVPYEVQIVLKKEKQLACSQKLLVYPSSLRLDKGGMYQVFSEFAEHVEKPLYVKL